MSSSSSSLTLSRSSLSYPSSLLFLSFLFSFSSLYSSSVSRIPRTFSTLTPGTSNTQIQNMVAEDHQARVGPYAISALVGSGATAEVKLAIHQRTGAKMAVKIIEKVGGVSSPLLLSLPLSPKYSYVSPSPLLLLHALFFPLHWFQISKGKVWCQKYCTYGKRNCGHEGIEASSCSSIRRPL